ncbi:unnamed protein product, partial [Ranitomeya imitator]
MLSARKASSASIYHRVWKTFFSWCRLRGHPPLAFSIPCILNFLQSGLDSGLALSSLKGQISALSVLFQRRIAANLQVKTFIQGVSHVVPPYRMPLETWDLNLVLGVLQEPLFEPLQDVPLSVLSWKVAFLVAVTSIRRVSELAALSCRAPFLAFHQDKVVLRPSPAFLPKVVSSFHLNEDIILPSFCPQPKHRVEKALHTLDVCQPPSDSSITHGPVSPNEWLGEKDFTDSEDYPLIRPGIYWKKFRSNFCEFTSVLVQQCQYSVIYDGYLLNTIISLLLGLSDSCVRAFRHTSTLSAVKLLTALIRVILNLDINIDNSDRLYEVEKKRTHLKKINSRLEQLDKKRKKLQQRHREIEDMMDALLKGTFLPRYRDVVSEIRALCIEEIGVWMEMYPLLYLNDSYLKYVGWMLDKVPDVRLRSLIALHGIYEKKNLVSKMDLFTTRFKTTGGQQLENFSIYGPMTEAMNAQKTENSEHKIGQLMKLLDFFLESKLHDHMTYLVDSLWDCTPGFLKDWKCMTFILLQDSSEKRLGLSAIQENLLVELMLATVRQAVEGHPPVGRGAAKKV